MNARPLSYYAKAIRPQLPPEAFRAVPSRLLWLAVHVLIILAGTAALVRGAGGLLAAPAWSLLIGHSFAGAAFVGHETMHGAVVRNRRLRHLLGWLCFLPFSLSPRLWVAWHNKVHHGNTMVDGVDPDAYPTLATYRESRLARVADYFVVGYGRWFGFVTLLIGFSGQSIQMLVRWSRTTDALTPSERRLVWLEAIGAWAFWLVVAFAVGPRVFVFCFGLPLLVGNLIVISYILTNHNLSPLTAVNDPLLNSLSVEVPSLVHHLHLHFGLHVEHHLFPSMSSAYAPAVRAELRRLFPARYQSMRFSAALRLLMATPRVYAAPNRLHDPRSGREVSTLLPGDLDAAQPG